MSDRPQPILSYAPRGTVVRRVTECVEYREEAGTLTVLIPVPSTARMRMGPIVMLGVNGLLCLIAGAMTISAALEWATSWAVVALGAFVTLVLVDAMYLQARGLIRVVRFGRVAPRIVVSEGVLSVTSPLVRSGRWSQWEAGSILTVHALAAGGAPGLQTVLHLRLVRRDGVVATPRIPWPRDAGTQELETRLRAALRLDAAPQSG